MNTYADATNNNGVLVVIDKHLSEAHSKHNNKKENYKHTYQCLVKSHQNDWSIYKPHVIFLKRGAHPILIPVSPQHLALNKGYKRLKKVAIFQQLSRSRTNIKQSNYIPELAFEVADISEVLEFPEARGACSEGFPFSVKELIAHLWSFLRVVSLVFFKRI